MAQVQRKVKGQNPEMYTGSRKWKTTTKNVQCHKRNSERYILGEGCRILDLSLLIEHVKLAPDRLEAGQPVPAGIQVHAPLQSDHEHELQMPNCIMDHITD